jgi:hypothetical protein
VFVWITSVPCGKEMKGIMCFHSFPRGSLRTIIKIFLFLIVIQLTIYLNTFHSFLCYIPSITHYFKVYNSMVFNILTNVQSSILSNFTF